MYEIAICDDDKTFIAYIKRIIIQVNQDRKQLKFYEFSSGEAFIESLDKMEQKMDLLILDMELGGIDGDETARQFRLKNKNAVLVFCSGVRVPTVESFKATPYRYLLKSDSDEELLQEVKEILLEVERKTKVEYIVGHYRSNIIKVDVRNVMYIENAKRGSRIIVCKDCEEAKWESDILVDSKLQKLSERYPMMEFAHNSYIVNLNHVDKILNNEIYLDNGEILSISRSYQKSFKHRFIRTVSRKY